MSGTQPEITNTPTLEVGGMVYAGWTALSVERTIERMTSHFRISVTERWPGLAKTWQIKPFDPCVLKIGKDVELTGYVDDYAAEFDGQHHVVTITGRSKTQDLVDCSPDIKSGQFKGYTLEAIARAICQPFGIRVVVQTDASQIFPDVTLQRTETAFTFMERLGRLAGILLTDDEMGNLVLTTTGTTRAAGQIAQGQNILRGACKLSASRRFSNYIVKGQTAIGSAAGQSLSLTGFGGIPGGSAAPAPVQTNVKAEAIDPTVPRFRPKVSMAEAQLDQAGMQRRATWERNYAFGRGTELEVSVLGFRQDDGTLWTVNRLVSVVAPFLQADQDLLIVGTTMSLSDTAGRMTVLKLGPVEGYTPDPGQVKEHCRKRKGGKSAFDLTGFGGT